MDPHRPGTFGDVEFGLDLDRDSAYFTRNQEVFLIIAELFSSPSFPITSPATLTGSTGSGGSSCCLVSALPSFVIIPSDVDPHLGSPCRPPALLQGFCQLPESPQHVREHGHLSSNTPLLPLLNR